MKTFLALLLLPALSFAGTITTYHSPLGILTISSGTVAGGGGDSTIVYDTSTYSMSASVASPCTWNMTIGNGSAAANKVAVLACFATANAQPSAASIGGVSFVKQQQTDVANNHVSLWTAIAPPSGSQAISVTPSAGSCGGGTAALVCMAIDFTGVNQITPVDVSTGAAGGNNEATTWGSTRSTAYSGDMLVDVIMSNEPLSFTATAGQTKTAGYSDGSQYQSGAWSYKGPQSPAGSQTMSWTVSTYKNYSEAWIGLRPQ